MPGPDSGGIEKDLNDPPQIHVISKNDILVTP